MAVSQIDDGTQESGQDSGQTSADQQEMSGAEIVMICMSRPSACVSTTESSGSVAPTTGASASGEPAPVASAVAVSSSVVLLLSAASSAGWLPLLAAADVLTAVVRSSLAASSVSSPLQAAATNATASRLTRRCNVSARLIFDPPWSEMESTIEWNVPLTLSS